MLQTWNTESTWLLPTFFIQRTIPVWTVCLGMLGFEDLFVSLFVHENPAQSISAQAFVSLVWSPLKDMNSQPEDRKRKLEDLASKVGEEISKEIDDLEERAAKLDRERQQFEREKAPCVLRKRRAATCWNSMLVVVYSRKNPLYEKIYENI